MEFMRSVRIASLLILVVGAVAFGIVQHRSAVADDAAVKTSPAVVADAGKTAAPAASAEQVAAAPPAVKPKFDPVAANGPIFQDWPKPQLAIVFSGELDGYIEPCGCTGIENQKGGLKRRGAMLQQLEKLVLPAHARERMS